MDPPDFFLAFLVFSVPVVVSAGGDASGGDWTAVALSWGLPDFTLSAATAPPCKMSLAWSSFEGLAASGFVAWAGKVHRGTHCMVHGAAGSGLCRQAEPHSSNCPPVAVHHCRSAYSHSEYFSNHLPLLLWHTFAKSSVCPSCATPMVEIAMVKKDPITVATE